MSHLELSRRLAMALPEVTESEHHGMVSFRVRDKIFATVPDEDHLRIMVAEPGILAAAAEFPQTCAPVYWGKRLACVAVDLRTADPDLVAELLADAWARKAPRGLVARSEGG
jgi:hypothetical protein